MTTTSAMPQSAALAESASALALGPMCALAVAETQLSRVCARRPPVHSVIIGACTLAHAGGVHHDRAFALPPNTLHRIEHFEAKVAMVAYLDARRYSFADAERLAQHWRGFVPGRDDPREALGDALQRPRRRLDPRVEALLGMLELGDVSVAEAARGARLSESRATHLLSEQLGAPPRIWRTWFRLRSAIGAATLQGMSLTEAAHAAGFFDSAHLTRTCRSLLGVAPKQMLPRDVYATLDV